MSSRPYLPTPSSSDENIHVNRECGSESLGPEVRCSQEKLKKWKSLEGDWKTFKDMEGKQSVHSDDGETTSSDYRLTPDPNFDECDEDEWRSVSRSSTHEGRGAAEERATGGFDLYMATPAALRLVRESLEKSSWSSDPAGLLSTNHSNERCLPGRRLANPSVSYSFDSFSPRQHRRHEVQDVVNSSYPLLKENFSLLEKLKRERDVCRQLENDMKDLEGQIQDVSKSFELDNDELEFEESGNESEAGYSPEPVLNCHRFNNSAEQVYEDEEMEEDEYQGTTTHLIGETDPLIVIEGTFSRLLNLADRLEDSVRERDLELLELEDELHREAPHHPMHTLPREWLRMERSRELSKIPSELLSLLSDLQAALRALLAYRGERQKCDERGDRECSSPASFTYSGSKVIVPTVRTIFSPVGNSVEMRPIAVNGDSNVNANENDAEEIDGDGEKSGSRSRSPSCETEDQEVFIDEEEGECDGNTLDQKSELDNEEQVCDQNSVIPDEESSSDGERCRKGEDGSLQETRPPITLSQDMPTSKHSVKPLEPRPTHERCMSEITYGTHYNASSEIIKRIERLQELVKPELCESLKQRALKIQKAKEEFLSGVSMPNMSEETPVDLDTDTSIVVEKLTLPNGLSVKEQVEDKKVMFPFLRKKKKESWSNEELCRESLILDDKSDWLRNPFRPKGKYKINK